MPTTTRHLARFAVAAFALLVGAPRAACADEYTLEVRVRDRVGAAVTALAFERYRADGSPDHPAPTIRTEQLEAADGVYRLTIEEAGTWAVRPAQEWARFVTHELQPWDSFVVVPAAALLDLVLLRPASAKGLVVDADGAPVAAAPVDITLHDKVGVEWSVTGARTDERGVIDLAELPATLAGEWVTLTVTAPESDARIEHRLEPRPGERIEGLVLTFAMSRTLAGVVRGADGAPAADVSVSLWRAAAPSFEPIEAWTGDDGRFTFELRAPGRYRVVADYGERLDPDRFEPMAVVDVDLASAPHTELVVAPVTFHGLQVSGVLAAAADVPVEHLLHFVAEGTGIFTSRRGCIADAEGRFSTHLSAGRYAVIADAAELGGLIDLGRVVISEGMSPLALAIPTGALRGQVVDHEGAPVAGAEVIALRSGGELTNAFVALGSRRCTTDDDGAFMFQAVEAGVWTVALADLFQGSLCAAPSTITLGVGETRGDLALRQVPSGRIVLRFAATAGASTPVTAADGQGQSELTCFVRDAVGAPRPPCGMKLEERGLQLPPGLHSVCVTSGGHVTGWSEPLEVLAGKEVELRLLLSPGAWLTLRCDEAQPAELSLHEGSRDVSALRAQPDFPFEGPSWSSREARFGPLPPGRYIARARCGDGVMLEHVVDLVVATHAEVVLKRM